MSTKRGKYGNITPHILKTRKSKSAGSYNPRPAGKKQRKGRIR